jgi:alcohol dehydrogenase, propanol-preferring
VLALRLHDPAPVETAPLRAEQVAAPEPGPGAVRLAVRACGLCHTDLHIVEGELALPRRPRIPGHQIVGVVDAVGPDVRRFRPGERVGVAWLHWACGACPACRRGEENLCPDGRFTGFHVDGGYAEAVTVPAAFAYRLPAGLPDATAAPLLCAGIIGYRALRVAGVRPGERLGLFGFGASAHLALQLARYWSCAVSVFTRSDAHRRLARELGAEWAGGIEARPPEPLDRAILFAPAGALIPLALARLRPGGSLAVAAIYIDGVPAFDYGLLYGERTVRSVTASTRADGEELLALAAAIPLRPEVELFPLAEANAALAALKTSKLRAAGVLVVE